MDTGRKYATDKQQISDFLPGYRFGIPLNLLRHISLRKSVFYLYNYTVSHLNRHSTMDFSFSEEQTQIKELANQILRDNSDDEFQMAFSKTDELYSEKLWSLFAESGLLGMAVPEEFGGSGFGLIEICQMLEEQGRFVAPIPLLPSLIYGGLTLAKYGSDAEKDKYLAPLASGNTILTAAIAEESMPAAIREQCSASQNGDNWTLNGTRIAVPYAEQASVIIVAADVDDKTALFLVEPGNNGVSCEYCDSANHEPLYSVTFNNADATVLGSVDSGAEILNFMLNNGMVACSATMIGITEDAMRRTAEYTGERKQFETTIASFQNTTMKLADCYIDIECLRSTYLEALWKQSEGLAADAEIRAAKYWACSAGHRVTHTCQHLHGGIGADREYPLHRYYIWFKQMDLTLGGSSKQLADLGELLANDSSINLLPETA